MGIVTLKTKKNFSLYSPPYIDVTLNNMNNRNNKNVYNILFNEIYESKSKLCDQQECINSDRYNTNINFNIFTLLIFYLFSLALFPIFYISDLLQSFF